MEKSAYYTQISYRLNVSANALTSRYRVYHGRHEHRPLFAHDRHFRKFPPRPDADAYAMNDATNADHANHAHEHDCDAYDGRMNAVNAVDELDVYFVWDADNGRKRNGFRRRNVDDTYYYTTAVWWPFSATELIVDLNCKREYFM